MAKLDESELWSAAEMARRCNIPTPRMMRAISYGHLIPDQTVLNGRLFLFRANRLPEIARIIAEQPRVHPEVVNG